VKGRQVGYVLIVLIVLGLAGLVARLVSVESQRAVLAGVRLLNADVVDKVVMRDGDNESTLLKVDGQWQIGPYPVLKRALEEIWETAGKFDKAELISSNPENHVLMGVSRENTTVVQFWREGELYEEFLVGDKVFAPVEGLQKIYTPWTTAARLCYLRRHDADEVYGVFCAFPDRFTADPRFWAEPSIVKIPRDEVEIITYLFPKAPDESYELRVVGSVWVVVTDGTSRDADLQAIDSLLVELEELVTSEFPFVSETEQLDFTEPDALMGIGARAGASARSTTLLFLEKEAGSYYVKDIENPWVYFLNTEDASRILKAGQDFIPVPTPTPTSGG
jgi:hypothetical protein